MIKHVNDYQNNPFFIGLNGLGLLFKKAQSVGIFGAVLAGIWLLISTIANAIDFVRQLNEPADATYSSNASISSIPVIDTGVWVVILVVILAISLLMIVISALLYSVLEYTSAQLAHDKKVELGEAFTKAIKNLPGYLWVYIIMYVKIFLWTLLLVVPGIIMSVRYSLAGVVFFAENKRGNAAVKRSAELTKGAWLTTFAGTNLWNLMTFGAITWLINPSANAILYRQLKETTDSNTPKPPAHWLSWLTLLGPIGLFIIFFGFFTLVLLALWATAQ